LPPADFEKGSLTNAAARRATILLSALKDLRGGQSASSADAEERYGSLAARAFPPVIAVAVAFGVYL